MTKSEWLEAYLQSRRGDMTVKFQDTGIAWAGFWIGTGIALAAGIISGQVILK